MSAVAYICYYAVMKRTTIFIPESLHEQLRAEAFRSHMSMAQLIRCRLQHKSASRERSPRIDPLLKVAGICGGRARLSKRIDEKLYGI